MEPIGPESFGASMGVPAWLVFVGLIAAAAALWAVFRRWRRTRSSPTLDLVAAPSAPQPVVARGDTPTIRLGDSQRIDRLHKVISLQAGEYVDLLDLTFDQIPRLRITFINVERVEGDEQHPAPRDCARIHLELGGAIAGCGALVKEVAVNQFLVPRATQDEHRCSILHFHGKDDLVNFLRVKVLNLDSERQSVDVDVLHVSGQWAG
jgi:hypothetical protein